MHSLALAMDSVQLISHIVAEQAAGQAMDNMEHGAAVLWNMTCHNSPLAYRRPCSLEVRADLYCLFALI